MHGKSAGRGLTSLENLQLIQEREKRKQKKALQKEEKKDYGMRKQKRLKMPKRRKKQ